MQSSISSNLRRLIALICIGLGVSVLLVFKVLAAKQVDERAREDSQFATAAVSSFIKDQGDVLRSITTFMSTTPRVRMLVESDAQTATDAAEELRRDAGVDGLEIVDRNGKLLGAAGDAAGDDSPIREALAGRGWSGIVNRGGELLFAVSEPLKIGVGEDAFVQGAVTSYLRFGSDRAQEFKQSLGTDLVFTDHGNPVGGSINAGGADLPKAEREPVTVSLADTDYIALYAALPGSKPADHEGIVTFRRVDEVAGPYKRLSFAFGLILGFLALVALVAGSIFAKGLAKPLDGVVAAARQLQSGGWPEKFHVDRKDEIGLLQNVFNEMTGSLKEAQAKLLSMLDLDPLTELHNHRSFRERLDRAVEEASADGGHLSLLLLDIDQFKAFNESNGMAAGDALLREIARLVRAKAPEGAVVGRYAGEEFAVAVPGETLDGAEELYHRIRSGLQGATLSAGAATLSIETSGADALLVAAELALSRAKQLGRDRCSRFDSTEDSASADALELQRYMKDASVATIQALAAAVDAKDPYTQGHSERVAQYAAELAEFLGESPEEVERVRKAGTLHDVGKIGVPDAILAKPGRLTEDEQRVMMTHPVLGELIVRKVPQLEDLVAGVRSHHERWDGKGYPDGLVGEAIPKVARYLAVADTYDAMTSDRPYRKGMDVNFALNEIEMNAGSQFDPEMALAFARIIRKSSIRKAA